MRHRRLSRRGAIHLPKPPQTLRVAHIRQGQMDLFDWPLADVAVALDIAQDGRLQTCRRHPWRRAEVRRVLFAAAIAEAAAIATR